MAVRNDYDWFSASQMMGNVGDPLGESESYKDALRGMNMLAQGLSSQKATNKTNSEPKTCEPSKPSHLNPKLLLTRKA